MVVNTTEIGKSDGCFKLISPNIKSKHLTYLRQES